MKNLKQNTDRGKTISYLSNDNPFVKIGYRFHLPSGKPWILNSGSIEKHCRQFTDAGIDIGGIRCLPSEFYALPRVLSNAQDEEGNIIFGSLNKVLLMRSQWTVYDVSMLEQIYDEPLGAGCQIINLVRKGSFSYGVFLTTTFSRGGQRVLETIDTIGFLHDMENFKYQPSSTIFQSPSSYQKIGNFKCFFRVLDWKGVWSDNIHTKYAESLGYKAGLGEFINYMDMCYLASDKKPETCLHLKKIFPMYENERIDIYKKDASIIFTNKANLICLEAEVK